MPRNFDRGTSRHWSCEVLSRRPSYLYTHLHNCWKKTVDDTFPSSLSQSVFTDWRSSEKTKRKSECAFSRNCTSSIPGRYFLQNAISLLSAILAKVAILCRQFQLEISIRHIAVVVKTPVIPSPTRVIILLLILLYDTLPNPTDPFNTFGARLTFLT